MATRRRKAPATPPGDPGAAASALVLQHKMPDFLGLSRATFFALRGSIPGRLVLPGMKTPAWHRPTLEAWLATLAAATDRPA